jgi:hypothetical protein
MRYEEGVGVLVVEDGGVIDHAVDQSFGDRSQGPGPCVPRGGRVSRLMRRHSYALIRWSANPAWVQVAVDRVI